MVQQKMLNLQDPIKIYLPDSVKVPDYKDQPIRLVHLATHTAGFLLSLKNGMSYEEMISKYMGSPLGFVNKLKLGVVVLTNSNENINDLGFNLLCPSIKLEPVKRPLANILLKKIENEGLDAAIRFYREIKTRKDNTYDFGYLQLNRLAVHYLDDKDVKTAIKLFKLNVEAYPKFVLCYLALAEAYMIGGEKKKAIETAEEALELDPDNLLAKKLLDHIKKK